MQNLLNEPVDYHIERTPRGTWKSFVGVNGQAFLEYRSHRCIGTLPLVHFTSGRDPGTGRHVVARGIIAVGRIAVGGVALGQVSVGVVAIGQAAVGLLFGLGQLATGVVAIGMLAIGLLLAIGQLAIALISIGQLSLGFLSLGQLTVARHGWNMRHADPLAKAFFRRWLGF